MTNFSNTSAINRLITFHTCFLIGSPTAMLAFPNIYDENWLLRGGLEVKMAPMSIIRCASTKCHMPLFQNMNCCQPGFPLHPSAVGLYTSPLHFGRYRSNTSSISFSQSIKLFEITTRIISLKMTSQCCISVYITMI